MSEENATFYCFKGWSESRKYYTTGRGHASPDIFTELHGKEERLDRILKDNEGRWPGLSGSGEEYFRFVVVDEKFDHGWPLMFDPRR